MGVCYSQEPLTKYTKDNTSFFEIKGIHIAKVVDVYDGDTITVVLLIHKTPYKFKCRLNGIDTPEIRTKNLEEKEMGLKAKKFLSDNILNHIVSLKCDGWDKYGRLLITIFYNKQNINQMMIDNKFAYKYDGGTKQKFEK